MARGRILAFSIDLRGRRYSILALLCECVMLHFIVRQLNGFNLSGDIKHYRATLNRSDR